MTSSKWIAVTMVFGLGLAFVPAAWADPASDACAALVDARGTLYSMISAKDKSAQDANSAWHADSSRIGRGCAEQSDRLEPRFGATMELGHRRRVSAARYARVRPANQINARAPAGRAASAAAAPSRATGSNRLGGAAAAG